MKKIMSRAWEIARQAVANFGGKVKMYFTEALKLAWAEAKAVKAITLDELKKIAAESYLDVNYWANYGKERLYIQDNRKSFGYIELNGGVIVDVKVKNQVNSYKGFIGYVVTNIA